MRVAMTVLGASVAAAFLAPAAMAGAVQLGAASISGLFPGYYQAEVQGYTLLISARTDGRMQGKAFGREDKGRWSIVGDQLCVSWSRWTNGESKCGDIVQDGSWYVATNSEDGELLRFTAIRASDFASQLASATEIERK